MLRRKNYQIYVNLIKKFQNLPIRNMPLRKSVAKNRNEKMKRNYNERKGLQTLLRVCMTGGKVGGCRKQHSLYLNETVANTETNPRACTNTMDVETNSEPGSDGADKSVEYIKIWQTGQQIFLKELVNQ